MKFTSRQSLRWVFAVCCCLAVCIGHTRGSAQNLPRVFVIGVSAPLTGDLAEYGTAVRNGMELAREQAKDELREIAFVYDDNRYEAAKGVASFNKLRELDRANLIFVWGEAPFYAVAPIAERLHFPVVAMSIDPIPARGKQFVIRSINYTEQYATKVLDYFRTKGFKKFGVIRTEDPFFNSMADGLRKGLRDGESLLIDESVLIDEKDFKTLVLRIKGQPLEALGVYLAPGQTSTFYQQASRFGVKLPTFGTDIFESETEIKKAGSLIEGAVYPNIDVPKEFTEEYRQRFGNQNQLAYAYNAYQFVQLVRFSALGTLSPRDTNEILRLLKEPPAGKVAFSFESSAQGGNYYRFPLALKGVANGSFKTLE